MATVALGSQRNQIERTAPPRGLWCDFPLGRPLGRPGDPEFQHRVLRHAFSLLDAAGPVFQVYDESIADDGNEVIACTLPPRHDPDLHPALDEANGLRPAYDRAVARFGNRAGTGRVVDADGIPAAIEAFIRIAEGTPWKEAGLPGIPARVAQDVRGYYELAALGLSDHAPPAWSGTRWFFDHTRTGDLVLQARVGDARSGRQATRVVLHGPRRPLSATSGVAQSPCRSDRRVPLWRHATQLRVTLPAPLVRPIYSSPTTSGPVAPCRCQWRGLPAGYCFTARDNRRCPPGGCRVTP